MTIAGDSPNPEGRGGSEEIEHTADRALRIRGQNLEALLRNAAAGLNRLMAPCPDEAETGWTPKELRLEAIDAEALLVSWLSELAFWAETERLVFKSFEFTAVGPTQLQARAYGRRASSFGTYVKAVTYHDLAIVPSEEGLSATVVFDV